MKSLLTRILALLLALAIGAIAAPGDLDPMDANIIGSSVYATAVQPDGKIIIAGQFTSIMGVPRSNIARINADGTLDMDFDPKANSSVRCVAVQPDGKVLLGGAFNTLQPNGAVSPTSRQFVARVNADGALDEGFDPEANGVVTSVSVQENGQVLLGGNFTELQPNGAVAPTERLRIARVNVDGTLDTGFDPKVDGIVYSVAEQENGQVLLGGNFTELQPNGAISPTARQYIARVNADGTVDTGFDPKANNAVYGVVVQADKSVLLCGEFTTLRPNGSETATTRWRIARVKNDGTLDAVFNPKANIRVHSMAVQADGRVLLGGGFTSLQPNGAASAIGRQGIARLNADGTLDVGFDPRASSIVYSVALQADGMVLLGGLFDTLQPNGAVMPVGRTRFARLENDTAPQTLSAPEATQVLWNRSGAAPELSHVTFELSSIGDGVNWVPLGPGTRVGTTPNWQLIGFALPPTGFLRAHGRTSGGFKNGSSGLIEQVSPFDTTPYGQWKLAELGAVNAPDTGNPDQDAYENLAEYGLVQPPTDFSVGPVGERFSYPEGDRLRIVFARDPARNDVTTEVLAADDLDGPWTPIASSVLGGVTTGAGYYGGDSARPGLKTVEVRDLYNVTDPAHPRRFLRLRVSR